MILEIYLAGALLSGSVLAVKDCRTEDRHMTKTECVAFSYALGLIWPYAVPASIVEKVREAE